MVLKRELTFVLPYLSKLSLDFKDEAKANYRRDLPYCKLKVIFKYKWRLKDTLKAFDNFLKKATKEYEVMFFNM